jgi:formamidopyrimidine-DNA glycosylase
MIEIPEAVNLAKQINQSLTGKKIISVIANQSPHKFTWFYGDYENYQSLLYGRQVETAYPLAGFVEIKLGNLRILANEGVNLRYCDSESLLPKKHQLLIKFDDSDYLAATVQMYGGLGCFRDGENENPYYLIAKQKPSPLTDAFSMEYFNDITGHEKLQKKSIKAVLATEQRIPGLGNGVLQDILFNAKIHPRRRLNTIDDEEWEGLYRSIINTLKEMTQKGGRDTETDLYGHPGGYQTRASNNTVNSPCATCGELIVKQSYMGGSIYFCPGCQPE